ncbi:tRNA lysidine(34) synthetase TilS [Asaia platycodi]|uniref:tRNA lysidine(34) synthetase TilS n=1 Tax=Asaia platycodi TaxID=610243 RepID=UPI0011DD65AD|nr:tRNA lysidine(34) synthetase TilS [Asaia platycodi]
MSVFGPFIPDLPRFPVAVAVSGGADSLCLAWLLRRWRRAVLALIVDHGLRENSAAEAAETASRLKALDIPSVILKLDTIDRKGSLQKNARIARYQALTAACLSRGILDLALGHHERDQVETLLLRKAHGSSPHGLAAMALSRETPQLRHIRPLLEIAPERLRATLREQGIVWLRIRATVIASSSGSASVSRLTKPATWRGAASLPCTRFSATRTLQKALKRSRNCMSIRLALLSWRHYPTTRLCWAVSGRVSQVRPIRRLPFFSKTLLHCRSQ